MASKQWSAIETEEESEIPGSIRARLRRAGVRCVNVMGGAGCGKTSLLHATAARLAPRRRVGLITADPYDGASGGAACRPSGPVVRVDVGSAMELAPRHVRAALEQLDLASLDLLLIENVSSLVGPSGIDVGECAKVTVFSVAAGAHKPAKYPDAVRCADAVILNKVDLLTLAPFDLPTFRDSVRRSNPGAALFELSTLTGEGMHRWLDWLMRRPAAKTEPVDRRAKKIVGRPRGR